MAGGGLVACVLDGLAAQLTLAHRQHVWQKVCEAHADASVDHRREQHLVHFCVREVAHNVETTLHDIGVCVRQEGVEQGAARVRVGGHLVLRHHGQRLVYPLVYVGCVFVGGGAQECVVRDAVGPHVVVAHQFDHFTRLHTHAAANKTLDNGVERGHVQESAVQHLAYQRHHLVEVSAVDAGVESNVVHERVRHHMRALHQPPEHLHCAGELAGRPIGSDEGEVQRHVDVALVLATPV
mmetsp:Transcript_23908/g.59080  ORF Transcript_23908/g.59080 Transcript_23908/m.59080 type:complete len:238 (-) Transcript_23908:139-852(-)